jgi:hypothetical protein
VHLDWKLVVDLLEALTWPTVAAMALYLLRKPLIELVGQIARRARKLSIYEVSVELATLPELSSSWSAGAFDVRQLTSAVVFDSYSKTLFQELLNPLPADYAVVDLGTGQKWLTSRLFIFAVVLGLARGLRAFAFLETINGTRRRFLGTAMPTDIRKALAMYYPWLEEAAVRAEAGYYGDAPVDQPLISRSSIQSPLLFGADQKAISDFVNRFIQNIQRTTTPPLNEQSSHLEIAGSPQTWERAHWIDGELLERVLTGSLNYAWCEESPDNLDELAEAVVRREGQFVALVDADRRFRRLVDHYELLGRMSKQGQQQGRNGKATE